MRRAKVYFKDELAGHLLDADDHFEFAYEEGYLFSGPAISVTLPLQREPFLSKRLFPFFDGLIVEGWLLENAKRNWKIDDNDRMGLLLLVGKDCIGAVSVEGERSDG